MLHRRLLLPFLAGLLLSCLVLFPAYAVRDLPTDEGETDPLQQLTPGLDGSQRENLLIDDQLPVPQIEGDAIEANESPASANIPVVHYGDSALPEAVRQTKSALENAASSGERKQIEAFVKSLKVKPIISFDPLLDPIDALIAASGDPEGHEILAILLETLEAGWVHIDGPDEEEMYVWPYFVRYPLDKLDARQRVELFKIVTANDLEDMLQFGAYSFYRLGIRPDGSWAYFVSGD